MSPPTQVKRRSVGRNWSPDRRGVTGEPTPGRASPIRTGPHRMSKRKSLAIVAAVAAFAAVSASAAGLGGLTGTSLGADTTIVASCDTDGIAVTYTTAYNVATSQYVVSAVNLAGVNAACNAKAANLTLSDST